MKRSKKSMLSVISLLMFTLPTTVMAGPFADPNEVPDSKEELIKFIDNVEILLLGVAAIVVFLAVIYSGFLYVTAGGDSQKLEKAKKAILYAFIGLSLVVFSRYLVVTFIKLIGGNVG